MAVIVHFIRDNSFRALPVMAASMGRSFGRDAIMERRRFSRRRGRWNLVIGMMISLLGTISRRSWLYFVGTTLWRRPMSKEDTWRGRRRGHACRWRRYRSSIFLAKWH